MNIAYARISTPDQSLQLQTDALTGYDRLFTDVASGAKTERPGLDKMLEMLRPGDTVVVWRLDRLGRNLRHLLELIDRFERDGVHFRSLTEGIDTSTPAGKMVFQIFGAVAEFERNLIRERTMAGISSARARGKSGGRPKGLSAKAQDKARIAQSLYVEQKVSISAIAEHLNIAKSTLYRYLRARGVEI